MKLRILRANQIIITDNGTPACLPRWARDEIVDQRLAINNAIEALMKEDTKEALIALGYENLVDIFNHLAKQKPS
jgi:hypothetical protein